jgi:tripartite-type tricarboxylate transporter receptor subunit TctC
MDCALCARGIPQDLIALIHADVVRLLNLPDVSDRLAQQGIDRVGNSPAEASAYLKSEITRWAKVIKAANMRVD